MSLSSSEDLVPNFDSFEDHPPQSLVRSGYVSRATRSLSKEDLDDIETTSLSRNQQLGICGLLITDQTMVFQILEGPATAVGELLKRIRKDDRHHGMKIFAITPVDEPAFGEWSMRIRPFPSGSPQQQQAFAGIFSVFEEARIPLELDPQRISFFKNLALSDA